MDTQATHASRGNVGTLARRASIFRFLFRYRRLAVFSGFDVSGQNGKEDDASPERFVQDLEALGPTFIKLGQMLSTRPDIVPLEYARALERMQENVEPVPFDQIREAVEQELGGRIGKLFESFDEKPLGSASLAQVHAATLRDGRPVAVKVQRPQIAAQLMADLDVLVGLSGVADRMTEVGRRVHLSDWVYEFRRLLLAELDYVAEAENLERFGQHLDRYPLLWVPQPMWSMTQSRVLTMELVTGTSVAQVPAVKKTEMDLRPLASSLMCGYLDQIFVHGEIHADPHPGNLRITDDGRLAIFDLGMVVHLPPRQRDRLLKLLFAAVDGRGEEVAEEALRLSIRLEEFDEARFLREVGQLISRYAAHEASISEGRVLMELVRLATNCGLRTPPELSMLGRALLNLDAVCRYLSPQMNVKAIVEEHLQEVMTARLRRSFSSSNLASEVMELQTFLRETPRKVSDILSLISENRLQLRMVGLEESHLMENLQKIANRIAAGVVAAAMIVAAALMMQVDTESRWLGYPTVALVVFLIGTVLGLCLVISALIFDRRAKRWEDHGPR